MLRLAEKHVLSLQPYIPGRGIEQDLRIHTWAKLGSNENCLGPSPLAIEAASASLSSAHLYPNGRRFQVIEKICDYLGAFSVKPNQVAIGNGTSELIVNLVRGVLGTSEGLLFGWPSFIMYRLAATAQGRKSIAVPVREDMSYDLKNMIKQAQKRTNNPVKLIFFANPNNPTGKYVAKRDLEKFISEIPKDVVLIIDEAYIEYVTKEDYPNGLAYALSRPRTLVLRTFSKAFGLAGLRLGYAVGDPDVINVLCRVRDPFNVNSVAQEAGIAALDDYDHVERSVKHNLHYRKVLMDGLVDLQFTVYESVGNFVLAKRNEEMPSIIDMCQQLLSLGVIIRPLKDYNLKDFVRISVGTESEITQLFDGLKSILKK